MNDALAAFCIGSVAGFTLCMGLGTLFPMTSPARAEAVRVGVAEYYLDSQNNRQWRWKLVEQ